MRAFDFLKLYGAVVFLHLATIYRQDDGVLFLISKPLIVISLLLFLLSKVREFKLKGLVYLVWALVFSEAGDIFLMNKDRPEYFLLGMGAFGLAHLFYILWYLIKGQPQLRIIPSLLSLLGAALALFALWEVAYIPYDLEGPIYIYFALLTLHLFLAWNAYGRRIKNIYPALGISLFILSDWLIAFDKFGEGTGVFWLDGFMVMLTYATAQAMIILGALKERLNKIDL